jgi:hypothetical protein
VQVHPLGHSAYVTSCEQTSLRLCHMYVSHIEHVIETSSLCTTYKSSLSPVFAKEIMSVLFI